MTRPDFLKAYREKRRFQETPEPRPRDVGRRAKQPIFAIQEHDATRLQYDLRIEAEGVLKSWAVPKGPSSDPRDKRLAVQTEDHPLAYAEFEGIIPEGQYGAGTVIVWDKGTYRNLTVKGGKLIPVPQAIEQGHLLFALEGEKLKGGYSLIRTGYGDGRGWLLVKLKDEGADPRRQPIETHPESVLSGRRLEEVSEATALGRRRAERRQPAWIGPMLATTGSGVPPGANWVFERMRNGERCIAYRKDDQVRLLSRNKQRLNDLYPELVAALREQEVEDFVIDGELVSEGKARTSQPGTGTGGEEAARQTGVAAQYYVFDLLHLNAHSTLKLPLRDRKALLRKAIAFRGPLRFSAHRVTTRWDYLRDACAKGWQGVIAKRADSPYVQGRSRHWLKFTCARDL